MNGLCRCIYRGEGEVVECEVCILRRLHARDEEGKDRRKKLGRIAAVVRALVLPPALASRKLDSVLVVRVSGPPVGKGRPKFDGRSRRAITPAKTAEWEERAGYFARSAAAEARWKFGPDDRFDVDLLTCSRDERRPDLDNVAKACLDALNGIIYQDDRHVEALAIRSGGAVPDPYVLITVRRFVPKGAP